MAAGIPVSGSLFSLCEGAHVVINTKMYEDINSDVKITLLKEETFGLSQMFGLG